ncbi:hypothetical protein FOWG_06187 [Fusarium oxysporum f. sp. lycopersici MN25]|nr:hypothetical protein FOWG_06187 [Fusarium oxysporum f. sp. lycopersici MN25]
MIVSLFWRVLRSILRTCWDWACLIYQLYVMRFFPQSLRASMAQRLMNGNYMSIMLGRRRSFAFWGETDLQPSQMVGPALSMDCLPSRPLPPTNDFADQPAKDTFHKR